MISYFKDKNKQSKKKHSKYKTSTTILKSFDTFVNIATISSSISLSLTGISLIALPISIALTCALSIVNKAIYENIINKNNIYRKQNKKYQQTLKFSDDLYRKSVQDNKTDKIA